MRQRRFRKRCVGRGGLLATAVTIAVLGVAWAWPAAAVEVYRSENVGVTFDTTITAGASVRVSDRDSTLVGFQNGGTGGSTLINYDDGNLNYDKGDVYSVNAKTTMELLADWRRPESPLANVAAFIRFNAFYDIIQNCRTCTQRNNLSSEARHRKSVIDGGVVGTQFLLLDAFLDTRFAAMDRTLDVRFGNQVLSWGESLFFQGGINSINAIDVAKIRLPGSELKDALVPAPIARVSTDLIGGLSLEGFYQFYWNRTQVDPVGSYWSTSDLVSRGAEGLFYGIVPALSPPFGPFPYLVGDPGSQSFIPPIAPGNPVLPAGFPGCIDCTAAELIAAGAGIPRAGDAKPPNQGQFGFALRYLLDVEPLLTAELGAYYIKYHSKTPTVGFDGLVLPAGVAGPLPIFNPGDFFRDYAEKVNLIGFSFSTEILNANVSGEISYRPDDPIPIDANDQSVIQWGGGLLAPRPTRTGGFVTEEKIQAQLSLIQTFGPSSRWGIGPFVELIGADTITLTTEYALVHYPNLPHECHSPSLDYRLAVAAGGGCVPLIGPGGERVDKTSHGYQMLMLIDYTNPLDIPITLTPSIGWAHAVGGNSPNGGPFVEEQQALTVGVEVDYLETWGGKVTYGRFMGAGDANLINDRDFFSFSVSYAF